MSQLQTQLCHSLDESERPILRDFFSSLDQSLAQRFYQHRYVAGFFRGSINGKQFLEKAVVKPIENNNGNFSER